ncbi:MAG: hypothetical protein ACYS9C_19485 [Planctomycetota bacterium]
MFFADIEIWRLAENQAGAGRVPIGRFRALALAPSGWHDLPKIFRQRTEVMSVSITPLCNDRKNIIVAMLFTRIVA